VIELNRSLAPYRNTRTAIRAGLILLGIAILAGVIWIGINQVQSYFISLTPTATATATITPTSTAPPSTATSTPRPSATPSLTPTPPSGIVAREIWVRNGCYETFRAIGQIPAGSQVRFLPVERRFDNVNRECLLIEFTTGEKTTLAGWILIADLGK
ncbi:MAG: hypothetical protein Q7U74_04720, partial [Saprospiraceae bacterium]|nr:hypothetical protein [Saprospiraceae bacterium]